MRRHSRLYFLDSDGSYHEIHLDLVKRLSAETDSPMEAKIFFGASRHLDRRSECIELALRQKLPIEFVDKRKMQRLCQDKPSQNVALQTSPMQVEEVADLEKAEISKERRNLYLALDKIADCGNLGNLIRSAVYFGASGLVLSERNAAPLSPFVSKSSAGAMEYAAIQVAPNMKKFLRNSKANGWRVIGTACPALNNRTANYENISYKEPTILVLGNESEGLDSSILEICDELAVIKGGNSALDSLNVATAAAIILSDWSTKVASSNLK